MRLNIKIDCATEGYPLARNTQVLVNGEPAKGITKVILTCEPNDLWRAEVHFIPGLINVQSITEITLVEDTRPDAQSIGSEYVEHRPVVPQATNVDGSPMEDSPDA
jgi:hypothetical protein